MKHSLNSRKVDVTQTAIGNYQKVRDQINKNLIDKDKKSISSPVTSSSKISVSKPLNDQKASYESNESDF